MVEFAKYTDEERLIVDAIVERADALFRGFGQRLDTMSLRMDLSATHAKVPLRLRDLLEADDFEFTHDIGGILRHMDRETGELGGCFVPRFSETDAWRKSVASGGALTPQDVIDTEAENAAEVA